MLVSKNFGDIVTFARASAGWSYSTGGVLVQAAANVPRLDYDPITLAARGLLVEEARTNLFTNSDGTVAQLGLSSGVSDAVSPIASYFSKSIQFPGAPGATAYAYKTATTTSSVQYCLSYFVLMDDGNGPVIGTTSNTGDFSMVCNGVIASSGVVSVNCGGGIYRVSTPYTVGTGAGMNFGVAKYTTQSARGFRVTGYQLEVGAAASSYIQTTAAQATRAADNATITDLSKIAYNQTEGTFISKFIVPQAASTAQGIFNVNDGTIANRFIAYVLSGGLRIMSAVSNVPLTINAGALPASGSAAKIAMAYKANDFAVSVNGGAVTMGSTLGLASGMSMLRLGGTNHAAGSEAFNSCLQRLDYIPVRKTNAELQTLSA